MIQQGYRDNFETLRKAFKNDDICIVECLDAVTKAPVITICATHSEGGDVEFTPFAKMFDGNPYEELTFPE